MANRASFPELAFQREQPAELLPSGDPVAGSSEESLAFSRPPFPCIRLPARPRSSPSRQREDPPRVFDSALPRTSLGLPEES